MKSWFWLALISAIFSAIEMALKKHALEQKNGRDNLIACITFVLVGIILGLAYRTQTGEWWVEKELSSAWWTAYRDHIILEVIAVFFLFKALKLADLSRLMPIFMGLVTLSVAFPAMHELKQYPSFLGWLGIGIITIGAFSMNFFYRKEKEGGKDKKKQEIFKATLFLIGTAACWAFTPTQRGVMIHETSPLFIGYVLHLGIGIAFILPVIVLGEIKSLPECFREGWKFNGVMLTIAVIMAIGNLCSYISIKETLVAYAMAVKETMPVFAFVIGYYFFNEKEHPVMKTIFTIIMFAGAALLRYN